MGLTISYVADNLVLVASNNNTSVETLSHVVLLTSGLGVGDITPVAPWTVSAGPVLRYKPGGVLSAQSVPVGGSVVVATFASAPSGTARAAYTANTSAEYTVSDVTGSPSLWVTADLDTSSSVVYQMAADVPLWYRPPVPVTVDSGGTLVTTANGIEVVAPASTPVVDTNVAVALTPTGAGDPSLDTAFQVAVSPATAVAYNVGETANLTVGVTLRLAARFFDPAEGGDTVTDVQLAAAPSGVTLKPWGGGDAVNGQVWLRRSEIASWALTTTVYNLNRAWQFWASFDNGQSFTQGGNLTLTSAPCFLGSAWVTQVLASGKTCKTRVDALNAGDRIVREGGAPVRIKRVHCSRGRVHCVMVFIQGHALGEGCPHRHVLVTPNHRVRTGLGHALVPAAALPRLMPRTCRFVQRHVQLFHIELERPMVLLLDGLPVESYVTKRT